MSSSETPDDRDPPKINLDQWIIQTATTVALIAMALMTVVYFYEPKSPEQQAKTRRHILELICGGQTVRLMTKEDIEDCRAAGIEWPPRVRP